MAIISCPECGRQVSSTAPTCPGCGAKISSAQLLPAKKRSNPWMIIGWIFLAIIILPLAMCTGALVLGVGGKSYSDYREKAKQTAASPATTSSAAPATSTQPSPTYQVHSEGVDCAPVGSGSMGVARVTVTNTGNTAIPFAKAFFKLEAKDGTVLDRRDSYFSPSTIPPGSKASADVYFRNPPRGSACAIDSIQDGKGMPVTVI